MNNTFIDVVFLLFTIILLCKIIAYSLYEIQNENNLFGGVFTIVFSVASVVFSNTMVWIS